MRVCYIFIRSDYGVACLGAMPFTFVVFHSFLFGRPLSIGAWQPDEQSTGLIRELRSLEIFLMVLLAAIGIEFNGRNAPV